LTNHFICGTYHEHCWKSWISDNDNPDQERGIPNMLTTAISLLFLLAAALSVLVIARMIAGNLAAIASALRGEGAYPAAGQPDGASPRRASVRIGAVRQGYARQTHRAAAVSPLRAAA
jgi:hypothetical protein